LNFELRKGIDMQSLEQRRRDRAARKAAEAGLNLSPEAALVAAEIADRNGVPNALGGIGRVRFQNVLY
jgi:hypothetical protein